MTNKQKPSLSRLSPLILRGLKYDILPGNFLPGFVGTDLYNRVFRFWCAFWEDVLISIGSQEKINPNDFIRSDFVTAITHGEDIVGVHLYSLLNFEKSSVSSHPYFSGKHEQEFLRRLLRRGCHSAMSLEFLTVNAKWRKSVIGIPMGHVVSGLGFRIQEALSIDATLGRCRQDVKTNDIMTSVGAETILQDVKMHNVMTDFCALFLDGIRPHPEPAITEVIDALWNRRQDWTGRTYEQNTGQLGTSRTRKVA